MPFGSYSRLDRRPIRIQDLFLNVRCEEGQIHDLRQAGTGYIPEPRDVGLVADLAAIDHTLEFDCESQEAGDTRDLRRWRHLGTGLPTAAPMPHRGDAD